MLGSVSSAFWVVACLSLTATTRRADGNAEMCAGTQSEALDPDSKCIAATHITRAELNACLGMQRGELCRISILPRRPRVQWRKKPGQAASPALSPSGQIKWGMPEWDDEAKERQKVGMRGKKTDCNVRQRGQDTVKQRQRSPWIEQDQTWWSKDVNHVGRWSRNAAE